MNDLINEQDILKVRVIATGMSIFFLLMGILTIMSRHYSVVVELTNIKQIMLAQVDLYMGLVQMSLALVFLTVWFNSKKTMLNWCIFSVMLAVIFFCIMVSKIM